MGNTEVYIIFLIVQLQGDTELFENIWLLTYLNRKLLLYSSLKSSYLNFQLSVFICTHKFVHTIQNCRDYADPLLFLYCQ